MRSSIAVVMVAALIVACGEVSAPRRTTDFYDWRLPVGSDSLAFSWPASRLPVRIWVEDSLGLPGHVQAGIDTWKRQFLYREWNAVIVADSATADVIVAATPVPIALSAIRLGGSAPGCQGETAFDTDSPVTPTGIQLPMVVTITPRTTDPLGPAAQSCYAITVAHEIGHTIGLFQHPPDPNDLMYFDPTTGPSARDRNSAELLYNISPDLVPIDR